MLEHSSHMDLYDLCDALYVSYSTIKADIAKMHKAFANFHIEFTCENEEVDVYKRQACIGVISFLSESTTLL